MSTDFSYDVFLSHSSKDKPVVRKLAERLRADGLRVWFDEWEIQPGDPISMKIEEGLEQSRTLVLCMSENAFASEWVTLERHTALFRDPTNKERRFVPLKMDDAEITDVLKQFAYVDWRKKSDEQYARLLKACGPSCAVAKPGIAPSSGSLVTIEQRVFLSKLPTVSGELFGRKKELAVLDRAWDDPHTHILMFHAWGGVGKTALVNHWLGHARDDHYRGAERVYGWSFYSQGTREDRQASADEFLAHALEWFGDPDPSQGAPWEKGVRLAGLIVRHRTLLILDGLEPLQHPPGAMRGGLRDQGMLALVKELARAGDDWGLCVISTRLAVPELEEMKKASVRSRPLDNLSEKAGAQLLRNLGVTNGTDKELEAASRDFKGHALALTLLGRYLAVVHDGEIRKRDLVPALEDEESHGGHARRVMRCYEIWLKAKPELDILHLLGLFDRPAEGGAIEVLRQEPAIDGLTSALTGLSAAEWPYALQHLRDLRLLDRKDDACPDTLDCHPLVREHFGAALKAANPAAWKEAHSRLYEYYKALPEKLYSKHLPDTLEEMEPLLRAVAHGCLAGRHQETLDEVYYPRIQRDGRINYCCAHLGAFGADLASLSGFFQIPWSRLAAGLTDHHKALVLSLAGFRLRALGRLREAREPVRAGLQAHIRVEDWGNVARAACNLSELSLTLGEVGEAVEYARRSVEYADRTGEWEDRMMRRTTRADALHQAGDLADAERLFREAESLQEEHQPEYPLLYSQQGYQFCDLLLNQGRFREVRDRATKFFEWRVPSDSLLDIALDNLSLGRAVLLQALQPEPGERSSGFEEAARYLDQAVQRLREAGQQQELPRGLLARAELYRTTGQWAKAWRDLDEVYEIAERGEMRRFLADYHLEAARLGLAEGKKKQAREHLATARQMVEEMGYGRRKPEVEDLEKQLAGG